MYSNIQLNIFDVGSFDVQFLNVVFALDVGLFHLSVWVVFHVRYFGVQLPNIQSFNLQSSNIPTFKI
jgi:hypothetical protein